MVIRLAWSIVDRMTDKVPFASVRPMQSLDLLSRREMASLASAGEDVHELFRRCALAVLNTGGEIDDAREIYERHADFDLRVIPEARGLKLELFNSPGSAFVDGRMIAGIRSHLFCPCRRYSSATAPPAAAAPLPPLGFLQ